MVHHLARDFTTDMLKRPKAYVPKRFFTELRKFNPRFEEGKQNDAHVCIQSIIDGLHEDLRSNPNDEQIYFNPDAELEEQALEAWNSYQTLNASPIAKMFVGMYKSMYK
jgi:ubiquitin C-terminal hydrolase